MTLGLRVAVIASVLLVGVQAAPFVFDASELSASSSSRHLLAGHMSWMYLGAEMDHGECECCSWTCMRGWFQNNGTCFRCSQMCSAGMGTTMTWEADSKNKKYMSKMCNAPGNMNMDRECTSCDYLASGTNLMGSGTTGNCSSGYYKKCTNMNNTHCVGCTASCAANMVVTDVCDGSDFRDTQCAAMTTCDGSYTTSGTADATGKNSHRSLKSTPDYVPSNDYAAIGYLAGSHSQTGTQPSCVTCPTLSSSSCNSKTQYQACGVGKSTAANGNTTCIDCESCNAGEYVSTKCGSNSVWQYTVCSKCTTSSSCQAVSNSVANGNSPTYLNGTCLGASNPVWHEYSSSPTSCIACKDHTAAGCGSWQYVTCTQTADSTCVNCTTDSSSCTAAGANSITGGTYLSTSTCGSDFRDNECTACTACSPSSTEKTSPTYPTTQCTRDTNRVCTSCGNPNCASGQYSACGYVPTGTYTFNSGPSCHTCTTCADGKYASASCSGWSDTTCTDHSECDAEDGDDMSATSYTVTAGNAVNDTVCSATCSNWTSLQCTSSQRATCNTADKNMCKACTAVSGTMVGATTCENGKFPDSSTCGTVATNFQDTQCSPCTNMPAGVIMPVAPSPVSTDGYDPPAPHTAWDTNTDYVMAAGNAGGMWDWSSPGTSATTCMWHCKKGYYKMGTMCVVCPRNTTTAMDGATGPQFCQPMMPPPGMMQNIGGDGMAPRGTDGRRQICPAIPMGAMDNLDECRLYFTPSGGSCTACKTSCTGTDAGKVLGGLCGNMTDRVCTGAPVPKEGETILATVKFSAALDLSMSQADFFGTAGDAVRMAYETTVLKTANMWNSATNAANAGVTITSSPPPARRRTLLQNTVNVETTIKTADASAANNALSAINTAGASGLQSALQSSGNSVLASAGVSNFVQAVGGFEVVPPPATPQSSAVDTTTAPNTIGSSANLGPSVITLVLATIVACMWHL
mmetsp:Transcript_46684/g.73080  ORF Transcript_46684/g.73080 Transcript_46684/m.73080 type:complete len:969 (-) Transcript_46684:230-3136(-)|eukprot:CAMPEP_0184316450 /NCGR_PEP_ID=MMETSP1049-20130417/90187_1 /TAXON_ID=77928 /ORGANISM="Proteomonas sulcata, Strain CCMP704" /LENGTH=968 /DNA_ID=CAMNT_0026635425 /DNA_START=62 /DNA_END=2968 /DNA_ORIENTATION=+